MSIPLAITLLSCHSEAILFHNHRHQCVTDKTGVLYKVDIVVWPVYKYYDIAQYNCESNFIYKTLRPVMLDMYRSL
jgi:hypothetical protein